MKYIAVVLIFTLIFSAIAEDKNEGKKDSKEKGSGENKSEDDRSQGGNKSKGGHSAEDNHSKGGNKSKGDHSAEDDRSKGGNKSKGDHSANQDSGGSNESGGNNSRENKGSVQIEYSYNPKYGGYLYNKKDQTVAVLGYITGTVEFYNGKTGDKIIYISKESAGVYISASEGSWLVEKQSFAEYAKNLYALNDHYRLGEEKGIKFTAENIPEKVQKILATILRSQSPAYNEECKAFAYALEICKLTQLGRIRGFEYVFNRPINNLVTTSDLQKTVGYYRGWQRFFGDFDGGMEVLANKKIKMDYEVLLKSKTEFHLLLHFLEAVGPQSDLINIAKKRLNVEWKFFQLLAQLGGEVDYGFSGYLYVVSACVDFLNGRTSETYVAFILRNYFTSRRAVQIDYQKIWKTSISIFVKKTKELKIDGQLQEIITILRGIEQEKWIIKGVDMYAVLKITWSEKLPGKEDSVKKVLRALKNKNDKKN